jgi:hypothetical protein
MSKLITAQDILMQARDVIHCVSSAASGPVVLAGDTIVTVVNIAGEKIDEALALLNEYRAEADAQPNASE